MSVAFKSINVPLVEFCPGILVGEISYKIFFQTGKLSKGTIYGGVHAVLVYTQKNL